jgi:S-(hydroxymethyl)glutathione dehydrogenase / alcohol dehydrogenase
MISARAALLYGPGQDYKIDTVEFDEPGPGEVVVEMRACGMCHSDADR